MKRSDGYDDQAQAVESYPTLDPREGDSVETTLKKLLIKTGGGSTSGGGVVAPTQIRRRKKTYVSTTADQTINLDTVTGVAGGKVKSFAIDLVQNDDANKVATLTNANGDVDVLNGLQQGAFLQGLVAGEYVAELGSLVVEGTGVAGQNIVHLTWSEEL